MSESFKILWGSEQPVRHTGYGVVSREVAKRLVAMGHEVDCMGWDYCGEDWTHPEGWTMVDAGLGGFGAWRSFGGNSPSILESHLTSREPDAYLSLIDPWFIGHAVLSTNRMNVPYGAYLPIDGLPLSYRWRDILSNLHTPIWMSDFGRTAMQQFASDWATPETSPGGVEDFEPLLEHRIENPGRRIHHGVDTDVFKPLTAAEKIEARELTGLDRFDTLLACVGRNVNRKQHPRLLEALAKVVHEEGRKDVGLVMHTGDPMDDQQGWHLPHLVRELGLMNNVVFTDTSQNPLLGLTRERLAQVFGSADAHIMATGGEGFGVPSAEALSTGIPIILPDNSTGPELVGCGVPGQTNLHPAGGPMVGDRGWLVPCSDRIRGGTWAVGMGTAHIDSLAQTILDVADNQKQTRRLGRAGREFALKNLTWDSIASEFDDLLKNDLVGQPHHASTGKAGALPFSAP